MSHPQFAKSEPDCDSPTPRFDELTFGLFLVALTALAVVLAW